MQNAINWFEIPVNNMNRAIAFYEAMCGRSLRREPFGPPGSEMAIFNMPDDMSVQGALMFSPESQPSTSGTLVYLNAAPSIDAWLGRVQANGGSVAMPKFELPDGHGHIALIIDTEGNRVGLHTA
jgi:uncharacterized protein